MNMKIPGLEGSSPGRKLLVGTGTQDDQPFAAKKIQPLGNIGHGLRSDLVTFN